MKRILNFISKNYNYKMIIGIIIGMIIMGTGAYAITVAGNTVTYDNTNSGLTSTNVQSAIDELYTKSNKLKATVGLYRNTNIVKVMKYDETANSATLCITGNESTCEELAPTTTSTYNQGTIVDYKVNSNVIRRFYVLHDDGATLTLQDQKNIVDNVTYSNETDFVAAGGTESEWNSCAYTSGGTTYYGCSTRGPLTILTALESATNSWTNVNLTNYTPGTTSFLGNNKTGCTETICSENTYTMGEHSGRSRLITVPEAWNTGCVTGQIQTCPKYMYNYLRQGNGYDGIVDGDETSYGYWTMNAKLNSPALAWVVHYYGRVYYDLVGYTYSGARAVVEINK